MGSLVHQQLVIYEHVNLLVIKVLCFVSNFYLFHSIYPLFNFFLSFVSLSHPCPLPPDKVLCHLVTRPHLQSLQHRVIWGKAFLCTRWSEDIIFSIGRSGEKKLKYIGWSVEKNFLHRVIWGNDLQYRAIWGKAFFCTGWSEEIIYRIGWSREKHFSAQGDLKK